MTRAAAGLALAAALAGVPLALSAARGAGLPPSAASSGFPGWSRPVPLATTAVDARPAFTADQAGRLHVFYLDRDGGHGMVRWITATADGRVVRGPENLGSAELRASSVAAVASSLEIVVAWIAPAGSGMRPVAMRLGARAARPTPLGPVVDDAGPIAVALAADGVHMVWSQVSDGGRAIWYLPPGRRQATRVGAGDAPGLSAGAQGVWAVWWQRVAYDTYRLVASRLGGPGGPAITPLTGSLASSRLAPPAIARDAAGRLQVVYGTELRGLGPAVARLNWTQREPDGRIMTSRSLAPGSPFAGQAAAIPWKDDVAVAWADLRSGRSRSPEIYAGRLAGREHVEDRVTYTLAASTHPALASGPDRALLVAWLELTPGGRFTIVTASTAAPVPRRFILGIPELDLSIPGAALVFAGIAAVGALPYALFLTLATAFLTALGVLAGRALLDETGLWRWFVATGRRGTLSALLGALGLAWLVGALALPVVTQDSPWSALALLPIGGAWLWLRRRPDPTTGEGAALILLAIFLASLALILPWSARTLSRLAT